VLFRARAGSSLPQIVAVEQAGLRVHGDVSLVRKSRDLKVKVDCHCLDNSLILKLLVIVWTIDG
jgi:hypothetical protein